MKDYQQYVTLLFINKYKRGVLLLTWAPAPQNDYAQPCQHCTDMLQIKHFTRHVDIVVASWIRKVVLYKEQMTTKTFTTKKDYKVVNQRRLKGKRYSQLEKMRGQECSSIGKLCSWSWHSAFMVNLWREEATCSYNGKKNVCIIWSRRTEHNKRDMVMAFAVSEISKSYFP